MEPKPEVEDNQYWTGNTAGGKCKHTTKSAIGTNKMMMSVFCSQLLSEAGLKLRQCFDVFFSITSRRISHARFNLIAFY